MRIIAGSSGGIVLEAGPKGVRPTMDRIRGAVFSSLGDLVPGARVLDLFAGTGALGIEALSRGGASAVFVDHDERCCGCIRRNLVKCRLSGMVAASDAFRFIESRAEPESFDLIFADPPYAKESGDETERLCTSESLKKALSSKGIFVLETFFKFTLPTDCGWKLFRRKRTGETQLFLLGRNF